MIESKTDKFLEIAENHRKDTKKEKFVGTFSQYLKIFNNIADCNDKSEKWQKIILDLHQLIDSSTSEDKWEEKINKYVLGL